jgi:hypothetical protein
MEFGGDAEAAGRPIRVQGNRGKGPWFAVPKTRSYDHLRKPRNVDPAVNTARARVGIAARLDPEGNHSALKAELVEANIAAYIKKTLADAPPLTDEQRTKLAELLKPVRA